MNSKALWVATTAGVFALGLAASGWADSKPVDPTEKRFQSLEKQLRQLREIVLQAKDTGQPVQVRVTTEPDPQLDALQQRVDDLEQAARTRNDQIDGATHDLDVAKKAAADLQAELKSVEDRIAKLEAQVKADEQAAATAAAAASAARGRRAPGQPRRRLPARQAAAAGGPVHPGFPGLPELRRHLWRQPAGARSALLAGRDPLHPRPLSRRRRRLYRRDPRLASDQLGARRGGQARQGPGGAGQAGRRLQGARGVRPPLCGRARRHQDPRPGRARGRQVQGLIPPSKETAGAPGRDPPSR